MSARCGLGWGGVGKRQVKMEEQTMTSGQSRNAFLTLTPLPFPFYRQSLSSVHCLSSPSISRFCWGRREKAGSGWVGDVLTPLLHFYSKTSI